MQISSQSLQENQEKALQDQFITLLTDITSLEVMRDFVITFFSETEQSVFSKRVQILWHLNQGKSYEDISSELKVSSATISSVAAMKDKPAMKQALKLMQRDEFLASLFKRYY